MRNALILSKVTLWQIPARIAKQFNRAGKSQITIFNVQNIDHKCSAWLRKPRGAVVYAVGNDDGRILCLIFGIWVIGICL